MIRAPADSPDLRPEAAEAREERPADLRLVLPALAAWGAAALALTTRPPWPRVTVLACVAVAGALLLSPAVRAARRRSWQGAGNRVAAAAVLLCTAAGTAAGALRGADLYRGPVPEAARQHGPVTAELTVTTDPRTTRPRVWGDRAVQTAVLLEGQVVRVTTPEGESITTRAPVLVIVRPGQAARPWLSLLPSTRVTLTARAEPPAEGEGRFAAVLRVRGPGPPRTTGPPTPAQRTAGDLRAGLRLATEGLPPDSRALLPGLVVGDTSRIGTELHEAFKATDLTHLLAVSGSNLAIVLFLLIGPPGRALRAERGGLAPRLGISLRATALSGGALTLGFVVVCRPEPSVLRAAACGAITLLAIGTGRRRSLLPALAAAVLLLVLWDPWSARTYGFLLSVLATGSLLTIAPRWSTALRRRGVPGRVAEALAAAAAAQAVCAPVVVVFAERISLVAVPCNLLAEPAVAPATVLGFAALAAAPVSATAAELLARCAGWPAGWIAGVARAGAGLPGAQAEWPGGWWGALLLAAVTAVGTLLVRGSARRPWPAVGCALLLVLAVLRPPPLTRIATGWPPPRWSFAMCDVGQGDATVLAAGEGSAVVVDAGPDPALTDRCLKELGVRSVPLLLLTHFHADHVAGLPGALRGRSIGAIQTTSLEEPRDQAEFVRRTATAAGVRLIRPGRGERRRAGGLTWQVLWPAPGSAPGFGANQREPNDASVTLLVRTHSGLSLLLLGDLEPPAQRGLIRAHPALPRVDVLKVAHHGSAYQHPALLAAARPRLALISCGRDNPYGHPSLRTVSALRSQGALVMRTDTEGSIAVTGSGSRLRAVARGARPP
ncbi:ComEC/Rec2 family competence protein [Streptomyces sp. HNM0645]|uniref:ComEC/Rec2 family competence protein n=1 Tax=Streptomyces sp. HNM0645 TaxID=2782343 RepID=UPI0024B695E0|nr:ComEC/Rec2 family competence protein [Streptomyces sp. HNM0645]MDI9884174.1 ComEC/Rec2 family competence protein [Streptomyces sp. HNM0645]